MIYLFQDYALDTSCFEFRYAGTECTLTPKAFDLLCYLVEHRHRTVSREELHERLWPEQHVTDSSLNHCVMEARKAINHRGEALQILQTVRHRGYRFMASVVIQPSPTTARPVLPAVSTVELSVPLLGRRSELTALAAGLAQIQQGHGHVIELVGPAGIGKSRLLQEFFQRHVQHSHVRYAQACGRSYGHRRPFLPVRELLLQWHNMTAISTPTMLAAQLRQHCAALDMPAPGTALLLTALCGDAESAGQLDAVDAEIAQEHIYTTLVHLFLQESRRQPLVLVLEDVQWLDPSTENWLHLLRERSTDVPLLLLLSYRPDYQPRWAAPPSGRQMLLQPLSPEESRHLLHTLLPPTHAAEDLIQGLLRQAEGNPLALLTLARTVLASGQESGHPTVPETLEAAILGHLGRLSPTAQKLLHTVAVLDGVWEMAWLRAAWDGPGEVTVPLLELQQQGWCYQGEAGLWYAFLHTTFQDIVSNSLTATHRQALHRHVAEVLQAQPSDDSRCERLAYHYARAEQASQAFAALQQAVDRAARQHAYAEAVLLLQEARRWGARLPASSSPEEGCLRSCFRLANMLRILGQPAEALTLLADHERIRTAHQHIISASAWALLVGQLYGDMGDWQRANEQASLALADAAALPPRALALAHTILTQGYYWLEQHRLGVEHGQHAVAQWRHTTNSSSLAWSYVLLGLHYLAVGEVQHALTAAATVETLETTWLDTHLLASATWATGCIQALSGNAAAAIAACQQSLVSAPDPLTVALATGWMGYAHLEQGLIVLALECLQVAVTTLNALSYQRQASLFTVFLGTAHLHAQPPQWPRAQESGLQGLQMAQTSQYRTGMAWAHRLLGQIAAAQADWAAATQHLHTALELFMALEARLEIGRTHLALGELAHRQHQPTMARAQAMAADELFRALQVDAYVQQATRLLHTVS